MISSFYASGDHVAEGFELHPRDLDHIACIEHRELPTEASEEFLLKCVEMHLVAVAESQNLLQGGVGNLGGVRDCKYFFIDFWCYSSVGNCSQVDVPEEFFLRQPTLPRRLSSSRCLLFFKYLLGRRLCLCFLSRCRFRHNGVQKLALHIFAPSILPLSHCT